jgi:hypothetical protein
MVNHLYLSLKPYVVLRGHSRSSSLWDKTSQHHLARPAAAVVPDLSPLLVCMISKAYQLKSVKVTLHNHHHSLTPKQRSRINALIGHLRYVRSESFPFFFGGYNKLIH